MKKQKIVGLLLLAAFISIMGFNEPAFALSKINPKKLFKELDSKPSSWYKILPASKRFKLVMNDEAVLDLETGLVWERSPGTTQRNWNNAITHCYSKEVGGRKGWRLPTVEELASLVDTTQSNPALPAGHPFQNVQSSSYWSATTNFGNTSYAWFVGFSNGSVFDANGGKSSNNYVWCVRGGHGYDGGHNHN
jgi:hypothetical protein